MTHGLKKEVCIIGLGYIGLPTAAVLASKGYRVYGVDVSAKAVAAVRKGQVHIVEPGLQQVVAEAVRSGRLTAAHSP